MSKYNYNDNNNGASSGLGFGTVLFLIFLVLKLVNVIDWSWWWVTAPLWGSLVLYGLIVGIVFFCLWVQDLDCKIKIKKEWQKKKEEEIKKNNG